MRFQPLGPEGVQRRLEEIQRRIQERTGEPANPEGSTEFPGALRGAIGNGSSEVRPWNPFGDGSTVSARQTPSNLAPLIEKAATEAGVDPQLFDALVASESGYDPSARSRAGALGLSQLMPDTARSLGVQNPLDPTQNLQGGASHLAQMMKRFNGDPRLALAAYNAGPGAVEKFGGVPPYNETQRYVEKVMNLFQARKNS
jgi:soluble lytic murein transglycosylase-like protein